MFPIQADQVKQLKDAIGAFLATSQFVNVKGLANDISDSHAGVQRRIRVLEDHLRFAAERF